MQARGASGFALGLIEDAAEATAMPFAGALWSAFGPRTAFLAGAVLALAALAGVAASRRSFRRAGDA